MNIITAYPLWFIVFCLAAGILYSGLLYFRNKRSSLKASVVFVLAGFRFLAVSILCFLLLSPSVKSVKTIREKPILIFAQDNSASLLNNKDSAFYKEAYKQNVSNTLKALSSDFEIAVFSFGEKTTMSGLSDFNTAITYTEKQTDISALMKELGWRFKNREVSGIILATDGLYNKGYNPLYIPEADRYPVYTLALGDTNIRKDLIVDRIHHNKYAYLDNIFPLKIDIRALKCEGLSSRLEVYHKGKVVASRELGFESERAFHEVDIELIATEAGLQSYRIVLEGLGDELSLINNEKRIFIEVLDSREKILLLSDAPHPDISAIKAAVESRKNYDIDLFFADKPPATLDPYSLIILYQIPSKKPGNSNLLAEVFRTEKPLLFVLGKNSEMSVFNQIQPYLKIDSDKDLYNDVKAVFNNNFTLFNIGEREKSLIRNLPPLAVPFGNYEKPALSEVLFFQEIASVESDFPLLLFVQDAVRKAAVVAGEGIWRWRLHTYKAEKSHQLFDELIGKMVQYLSLKEDKSRFRINAPKSLLENEDLIFSAEFYNESYENIYDANIELEIIDEESGVFPFNFVPSDNGVYSVNIGNFPVGNYKYRANTQYGGELFEKRGGFVVRALEIENIQTLANHNLLKRLAEDNGGQMLYPDAIDEIPGLLSQRNDIHSQVFYQKKYTDLIELPAILIVIIILLSLEWFLRKYLGSY